MLLVQFAPGEAQELEDPGFLEHALAVCKAHQRGADILENGVKVGRVRQTEKGGWLADHWRGLSC